MNIHDPQPADTPPVLYKYRYFDPDGYHLRAIRDSHLWFSSARAFNDPFDSALKYNLDITDSDLRLNWAIDFVQRDFPHLSYDECRARAQLRLQEIDRDPNYNRGFQEMYVEANYDKFGVCCLTTIPDDLLMWSHYAYGHKGFVVGFDTQKILDIQEELAKKKELLDLQMVSYEKQKPVINFFESMTSDHWREDIIKLLITKSERWSYEQEYRIMLWDHIDTTLSLPSDCITEIIQGCRIEPDDERNLREAIIASSTSPTVFQSHIHKTDFKLIIEKSE